MLFKAVMFGEPTETRNHPFLNVEFANKGIEALNVSNILNPSKLKFLRTFNKRSHHAFPIAIPVLLLPKSSIIASLQHLDFQGLQCQEVMRNSLLKKWDQSDMDPAEIKGVIRTS